MATNTQPQPDLQALALTKAIRRQESGGNYSASGDAGTSTGAYQFQPATWKAFSGQILGNANAPMTPENQNAVAYGMIKTWKDSGMGPAQIAAKWNSGSDTGWENKIGTTTINGKSVPYNVPQYVQNVVSNFKQIYPQVSQQYGAPDQSGGLVPTANAATGTPATSNQSPSVSGFVQNIGTSAGNLLSGLGNAVMHPIDTLSNLAGTVAGGVEKAFGANNQDTQMFDNTIHYLGKRYGGSSIGEVVSNIGHTLYTDPVGAALDLSTLLDGAGAAVGAAGKIADISKVAELSKAADYISTVNGLIKTGTPEATALLKQEGTLTQISNALTTVGKYTNPLGAVAGIGKKAIGVAGRLGGEALGVSTGAGYGAIKGAFNAASSPEAQSAFRAGISGGEDAANTLVDSAQQAYSDLKLQRSSAYENALGDIKTGTHTLTPETVAPIFDTFDNLLNKYGITKNPEGELDFSNSRLRNEPVTVGDIQDISKEIQKYKDGEKQITPVNIDDLKQMIDARYSAGSRGSSFTTQLNNVVRKTLRTNVPKYEEMTSAYEQASNDLKDFRQSLSIGGKASRETIVKKLTSTLRANNEYRQTLLKEFSQGANKDIFSQAAGASMQSLIPLGLSKYAEGLAAFLNPHILLALPFSSPRLVGEFVNALGKGNAVLERIGNAFIKYKGPTILKAGIINNRQNEGTQ